MAKTITAAEVVRTTIVTTRHTYTCMCLLYKPIKVEVKS